MKNISILGSTGSIGTQTVEVCKYIGYNVLALSAYSNIKLLENQARLLKPKVISIYRKDLYSDLKNNLKDTNIEVLCGLEGIIKCATINQSAIVVNAIVGISGLIPTIESIKAKKNIALANKETIVTAGHIINELADKNNISIIPVDSEHSAIFQCLQGNKIDQVNKIILTASGGPFFGKNIDDLKNVTVQQALNHPNWSMGNKISIDSATLMNKGLEFIEAVHLFNLSTEKIDILIHRQSIIHSLVEYNDKSIIAQLGVADMKIPIQYALTYPDRFNCHTESLDLIKFNNLTFDKPDINTFLCLKACIKAIELGGLYTTLVNGSNEQAVDLFLNNKISFLDIGRLVLNSLNINLDNYKYNLENIIKVDKLAREYVLSNI